MKKKIRIIGNDRGAAVIVLAVLILVLVSVIGISSSDTARLEVQIASADRTYHHNFHKAEGAALEAAQRLENANDTVLKTRSEAWLNHQASLQQLYGPTNWNSGNSADAGFNDSMTSYSAVDTGICTGGSILVSNDTHLHSFKVLGLVNSTQQKVLIEMGYRKRF
jgi:Tfp pilus assembly protein PilX